MEKEPVSVDPGTKDVQEITPDEELAAFSRKDVSWTAEEERALVWKIGRHPSSSRSH
jgi:hypothetical protein